jgi:rRNA pseudouridine-1189 N-methylase Emg1 (Nep1/Mra1 family)
MVTVLLADTELEEKQIHEIENICHSVGWNVFIHYPDDDLDELLDLTDSAKVVFTPEGNLTLDEMVAKYGGNVLLIIGGFTEERDFDSDVYSHADDTVSLGGEFLSIPEVIEQTIEKYEEEAERGG